MRIVGFQCKCSPSELACTDLSFDKYFNVYEVSSDLFDGLTIVVQGSTRDYTKAKRGES